MKIRFLNFLLFAFCLLFSTDILAQSADVTAGCAPLRVNFTAPDGTTSYFWDFKDGATSELQNPSTLFVNPGTYEVEFKETSAGAVVGTVTVTVSASPTLTITATPNSGCSPLDVVFTNTTVIPDGITVLSEQWVFDDGTQATGSTVNKTYESAGMYSVSLAMTTSSDLCSGTAQFVNVVEVVAGPQVQFTTSPSPAASCTAPFTVNFSNQTPESADFTYSWDLGNGNTAAAYNPPAQTYTEDGDYTVTLSVTDNAKGCTKTFSRVVSIGSPSVSFEVADTVCAGIPVTFQNTSSAGNYTWDFVGFTSSTDANPDITFTTAGLQEVRLIVSSAAGCSNDFSKTIFVESADATFTADPIYGCSEPFGVTFTPNQNISSNSYAWEFGDDSTSTMPSLVHEYNADNDSPYHENGEFPFMPQLTVTSPAGCIDSFSTEIILDIPLARFMPDTVSGCAPLTVEFSDSSRSTQNIINWEWIYDNGETNNFSTNDAHNYTFTEPGEYEVQLVITNTLGCPDTSYMVLVEVGTMVTPDFTTDKTSICQGDTIQFSDASNSDLIDEWHYYTDNDRSSHCFNDANPMIPFETESGAFGVTMVVGYNGCLNAITKEDFLEVKGPIAQIDYTIPCVTPTRASFTNSSQDATTISWDFGDGETMTTDNPNHEYASSGDYQVILTAENAASGCPASFDTTTVHIRQLASIGEVAFEQCKSQPINLDATASIDVDTSCFKGYTWHFNHPGVRPLTINEPTNMEISYPDTGFYTIELVVEDINGCVDTSSYPVVVYEAIADFTMDKSTICFPMSVSFTNNSTTTAESIETYMWDFGDGVGMAETENANYNYGINPGGNSITVTLSIEDNAGCPGEKTMEIETYQPVSQITTDPAVPNICAGDVVNFSATDFTERGSSLEYSWDLGNGAGSAVSTATTPYNEGGTYDVILSIREIATGCPGEARTTVNVQDYPIAAIASDVDGDNPICHPQNITFTNASDSEDPLTTIWDLGNGQSGIGTQTASFFPKGTYTVTMSTQTSFGCADEISRVFDLVGPEGELQFDGGPFCKGDAVSASLINPSEVSSFSWFFEGQEFGANEANVSFDINDIPSNGDAPITLELVGPAGCTFALQENLTVRQVIADFAASVDPCSPDVAFTNNAIGGNSFNWDFGNGETTNNVSPAFTYATAGTYEVTLEVQNSSNGCSDAVTQTITVATPTPVIGRDLDTCVLAGTPISLPIRNNGVARLNFNNESGITCPEGGSIADCTTPVLSANTDIEYTLTVQDACFGTETYQYTIGVFDPNRELLPNAFTPDGDGTNDFFNVILSEAGCSEVTEVIDFKIFDRWGTKVYDNDTPTQGWNGLYKGTRQNPDVYIYAIEVRLNDGNTTTLAGDVTLIR